MPGIHCKHQIINTEPSTGDGILRPVCGLTSNGDQASPNQNQTNLSGSSQASKTGNNFSPNASTTTRKDECNELCPSTRTPVLLSPANGTNQDIGTELPMLVTLTQECLEELNWWDNNMCRWNGKTLIQREIDLVIDSDASLEGWGACCSKQGTGGPWSQQECSMLINCLELLAATLAVKTFAKTKTEISILLRVDNTTAVAYINTPFTVP